MPQDEGDRGGVEARVERVEHGPRHRDAVVRLQHRWRVRAQDRHRVAPADAQAAQSTGQSAAAPVDLAPTKRLVAIDDAGSLGKDRSTPGQKVERRQRTMVGACPRQSGIEYAGVTLAQARSSRSTYRRRLPGCGSLGECFGHGGISGRDLPAAGGDGQAQDQDQHRGVVDRVEQVLQAGLRQQIGCDGQDQRRRTGSAASLAARMARRVSTVSSSTTNRKPGGPAST